MSNPHDPDQLDAMDQSTIQSHAQAIPTTQTSLQPSIHPSLQSSAPQSHPTNLPTSSSLPFPTYSAATTAILERFQSAPVNSANYEAAREQVLKTLATTTQTPPSALTPQPATSNVTFDPNTPTNTPRGGGASGGRPRGRGRGRPPRLSAGTPASATAGSPATPISARGRPRGRGRGGARGGRRKRTRSSDISRSPSPLSDSASDASSSGHSTSAPFLPSKSRSGRRIQKPTQYDPATKTVSRRRGPYRRHYEAGVCRRCGRGAWTARNRIVFCDGCEGGWHQFCHWPGIGDEVVRDEGRAWFCSSCEGRKGDGATVGVADLGKLGSASELGWSEDKRKEVLDKLPPAALVGLLLHASTLMPNLAIFPVDEGKPLLGTDGQPGQLAQQTQPGGDVLMENAPLERQVEGIAALYPPPGAGLVLPLESDDASWLEDGDTKVFSHIYRDTPLAAGVGA